jgi:hypothetical protein
MHGNKSQSHASLCFDQACGCDQWPSGTCCGFAVPRNGGGAGGGTMELALAPCGGCGEFIWSSIGT